MNGVARMNKLAYSSNRSGRIYPPFRQSWRRSFSADKGWTVAAGSLAEGEPPRTPRDSRSCWSDPLLGLIGVTTRRLMVAS